MKLLLAKTRRENIFNVPLIAMPLLTLSNTFLYFFKYSHVIAVVLYPSFRSQLMNLNSVIQRSFTAFSVTDVLTVIPRFDLLLLFNGRLLMPTPNLSSNASII
ncbi:hypothetical protein BZG06_12105 [Salinivibrio kushneri]|nr:hypothetical protein BZG06_12105 [Salinivibrio kushneri]